MRHFPTLGALLATAALLCAMPWLARLPADVSRVDDTLLPARLRTLTVWLMNGDVGDRRLLGELCADFEKQQKGVRVFVRMVTADELDGETAVLPDIVLFETGDILTPERYFLPLDAQAGQSSGMHAGVQYARPLWLAPNVLTVPASWVAGDTVSAPKTDSLLAAATAPPTGKPSVFTAADLPWAQIAQAGKVEMPSGVGLQQLMYDCPASFRGRLAAAALGRLASDPTPVPTGGAWSTSQPKALGASPTPMPPLEGTARVETLAACLKRISSGEAVCACVLSMAVSSRVRYAALCRDNADARAFLACLQSVGQQAVSHSLIPIDSECGSADALISALLSSYRRSMLPNAFAHTAQELNELCRDGFINVREPSETLMRLR